MLKCVQRSKDSQLDLTSGLQLQATRLMHTCQECKKLKRHASYSLQDKSSRLAWPFAHSLNSRLNPVARSSRQNILCWQNMTFHIPSHPTIYIYAFIPTIQRELPERIFKRETLEKKRLTHPQSLPKRLLKFIYSLPLHCQILERLITKTFSHHIHFCEKAVWCFEK